MIDGSSRLAIAAVGHAAPDGHDLRGATRIRPTRLPTPPRAVRW
ncbi:hypothetical protein [Actinophytocola sp.]|nr:hypothetical protein [Actinophytocola sp.]